MSAHVAADAAEARVVSGPTHAHACAACGWHVEHADALRVRHRLLGRDRPGREGYRELHRCRCGGLALTIAARRPGAAAALSPGDVAAAARRLLAESLRGAMVALLLLPWLLLGGERRFDALSVAWYVGRRRRVSWNLTGGGRATRPPRVTLRTDRQR